MRYRHIATPLERRERAEYNPVTVAQFLDESRAISVAEQRAVVGKLPCTLTKGYRYPPVQVEVSREYTSSIAIVAREEQKIFYFPFTKTNAINLSIAYLTDFADELEYFLDQVVAGDAFERAVTCCVSDSILVLTCDRGHYELVSRHVGTNVRSIIKFDLFAIRELLQLLRSFEVSSKGWKAMHLK